MLPERGAKRICGSCGLKFYDLAKSPIICPKCGTEHDPLAALKLKRQTQSPSDAAKSRAKPKLKKVVDVDDDDDLIDDDDDDDDDDDESLIEDTSDIGGDDDDDLSEVRENIGGDDDTDRT
ncbi:MAG: FYDLN acid domain-containing protein [Rhodospirillales bacterium]